MYQTYPEDFFLLVRQIKMRRIDNMLTDIMIVTNPHVEDPKQLVDSLLEQQRFMNHEEPSPEIDRAGLEALKKQLGMSKSIKVRQVII